MSNGACRIIIKSFRLFSDLNFSYTNRMKNYPIILILILIFFSSCSHRTQTKSRHDSVPTTTKYQRSAWNHWTDSDDDCLNTRAEILKQRSLVTVTMNKKGCVVKKGQWNDYYYPEVHTLASKVDIDHLIPLKHAHEVGGAAWSAREKEKFANDPQNLVITNRSYNRQKGAKGIDEWLPRHQAYACKYVRDWIKLKSKYSLKTRPAEIDTIESLKADCRL